MMKIYSRVRGLSMGPSLLRSVLPSRRAGRQNPKHRSTFTILLMLLSAPLMVLAIGCGSSPSPIVFNSDRDGNLEIYSIGADGEGLTNLTNSPQDEKSPLVSPDRQLVSYLSVSTGATTVEFMLIDGSERKSVSPRKGDHRSQRWSPTSDRIAYVMEEQNEKPLVYVATTDGKEPLLLRREAGDEVGDWSSDGDSVAFVVLSGDGQGIYTRNPDGVNEFRVTDTPDSDPVWSPDSGTIVFLSTRDGNAEIYVMDADGSNQRRITDSNEGEYAISWSPDGKWILFVSERDGNAEIYVTDPDGEEQTRLTFNNSRDDQPVWSPDGKMIVFVSYLDGDAEIIVMNADGNDQVRLTNNEAQDTNPSW